MSEQLQAENRNTLVGVAVLITFPYLWLGLFAVLAWLYHVGFFGRGWGSYIVPGLLCLVFLVPAIPWALTKLLVRPLFTNLLGREIITESGCMVGLVSVVIAGLVAIYLLSRGAFKTVGLLFLSAPFVGGVLAGGVSLLARGGGISLRRKRHSAPPITSVEKPRSFGLPKSKRKPSLPTDKSRTLPASTENLARKPTRRRRNEKGGSARRPAPPPRRQ